MTMIEVSPQIILDSCRRALGLPVTGSANFEVCLLASLVRRAAGFLCPCSRATLRTGVVESLQGLGGNCEALSNTIDGVIKDLIDCGDLLELTNVAVFDLDVNSTNVFLGPPRFIIRRSGNIYLIGVVPDYDFFLTLHHQFNEQVVCEHFIRMLKKKAGEDPKLLKEELLQLGLQELPEDVWLKFPRATTASKLLEKMERELEQRSFAGSIGDIKIIDSTRAVKFYKGRNVAPNRNHSGNFVGRRPRDFGPPIWCFLSLEAGIPTRVLDFPMPADRWQGRDTAWYLQAAIDACRSSPQLFRRLPDHGGIRFDFFSPLPQWAERRLKIFGCSKQVRGTLFSYWLPEEEAEIEENFLKRNLWLGLTGDSA